MFKGVNIKLKLTYFISMMMVSYILYLAQFNHHFGDKYPIMKDGVVFFIIIILSSGFLAGLVFKRALEKMYSMKETTKHFTLESESLYNGNFATMLISTVLLPIIMPYKDIWQSVIILIVTQVILYCIITRSNGAAYNVALIIMGMGIYKVIDKDGHIKHIIAFGNTLNGGLFKIGNNINNTYILKQCEEKEKI